MMTEKPPFGPFSTPDGLGGFLEPPPVEAEFHARWLGDDSPLSDRAKEILSDATRQLGPWSFHDVVLNVFETLTDVVLETRTGTKRFSLGLSLATTAMPRTHRQRISDAGPVQLIEVDWGAGYEIIGPDLPHPQKFDDYTTALQSFAKLRGEPH